MSDVASIFCDHRKRRAGIKSEGRIHWLPPAFYEPAARLAQKYDAMDAAMTQWQQLLDEAMEAANG